VDIFHWWEQDLVILPTGDLLLASGTIEGEQRVLRRLLTSPGKYVFHLEYGAGLPNYVGQPVPVQSVASLISSQMALEDAVSQSPLPVVQARGNALGSLNVNIKYVDANTGLPALLDFDVSQ
jgi:phage baseplate assembly protein W